MADTRQKRGGMTATPAKEYQAGPAVDDRCDRELSSINLLEKAEFHRLWCLYLAWRMATGTTEQELRGSGMEGNLISDIETEAKRLIAPHWPSSLQCSFLVALMCSTADTANRFSRAAEQENGSYVELAFEMFWHGLVKLTQEHQA